MARASSSSKEGNLDSVARPLVIPLVGAMEPDTGSEGNLGDEIFDVLGVEVGEIAL